MCYLTTVFNCDYNVYVMSQNIILIAVEGLYSQSASGYSGQEENKF